MELKPPRTRYALSGTSRIAYQVVGQGFFDLVYVPGFFSSLEAFWEDPDNAHLLNRLGAFSRLIVIDQRGSGLSDGVDPDRPVIGLRVRHGQFGDGKVIACDGQGPNAKLTVDFPSVGLKRVIAKFLVPMS